jgi:hypothetical protein
MGCRLASKLDDDDRETRHNISVQRSFWDL